mgnify:CR=1 FL=1
MGLGRQLLERLGAVHGLHVYGITDPVRASERCPTVAFTLDGHTPAEVTRFLGERGRGTHEYRGVMGRIDIITGTLGKALGGASGGYTSGRKEIVGWLRQRSRPYLFSNSVAPIIAAASIAVRSALTRVITAPCLGPPSHSSSSGVNNRSTNPPSRSASVPSRASPMYSISFKASRAMPVL